MVRKVNVDRCSKDVSLKSLRALCFLIQSLLSCKTYAEFRKVCKFKSSWVKWCSREDELESEHSFSLFSAAALYIVLNAALRLLSDLAYKKVDLGLPLRYEDAYSNRSLRRYFKTLYPEFDMNLWRNLDSGADK